MEKEKRSPIPKPSRVSNSKLEISNALKYRENIPLDSNYLNFLKDNLNVVLFPFEDDDSQVNTEISSWVLKNSNNKIQYLPEKDENAIINLIYFRGTWKYTFDNKYTKKRTFFTNNKIIRTETMYKKNPFSSYEDKKIHAVKLPYASCNMSVIILCPKKKRTSLNELDMDYWKSITNNLGGFYNIKLYLPKFSYSSSLIFDSDFWAQQGITDDYSSNQELYISTILHNTFIEMDEEKTEAWFITSAYRIGGRAKSKIVKANKPFLFFIVDDTSDLILFTGKYVGCK